jgi:peptidoglycan/xylan/chitin deacetylase (PgdA/CDA1 family)
MKLATRLGPAKRVLLLCYHHAGAPPAGFRRAKLWVSAGLLTLHVRFLQLLGWRFDTVSGALAARDGWLACITFDDGFRDVVRVALPALAPLGVPATIYVVTRHAGRDAVAFAEDDGTAASDLASWDELRAARDAGWEVGSHAAEHRRLALLLPAEQRALVAESRDAIARELGAPPRAFAYPYGSHDDDTVEAVRDAGFESAVTTQRGVVGAGDDRLRLVRVTIGGYRPWHALRLVKLLAAHLGVLPPLRRRARPR